jgi:hypothetical protein
MAATVRLDEIAGALDMQLDGRSFFPDRRGMAGIYSAMEPCASYQSPPLKLRSGLPESL